MVSLNTILAIGGLGAAYLIFKNLGGAAGIGSSIGGGFNTFGQLSKTWTGEKGPLSGVSIFPDFQLNLTPSNRGIIVQQAQFETAQGNIGKANEMIIRQQGEIDRLNEEYQTRFGGLSRYG